MPDPKRPVKKTPPAPERDWLGDLNAARRERMAPSSRRIEDLARKFVRGRIADMRSESQLPAALMSANRTPEQEELVRGQMLSIAESVNPLARVGKAVAKVAKPTVKDVVAKVANRIQGSTQSTRGGVARMGSRTYDEIIKPRQAAAAPRAGFAGKGAKPKPPAPTPDEPERIRRPAYRAPDGTIFEGTHHYDANEKAWKAGKADPAYIDEEGAGYTTTTGRWVNREEADEIAVRMDQKGVDPDGNTVEGSLATEDLINLPPAPRRKRNRPGFAGPGAPTRTIKVEHYSERPDLDTLDPKKAGTGQAGEERARSSRPPAMHLYDASQPAKFEERFRGKFRYTSEIDESRLYDREADPDGITAAVIRQFTKAGTPGDRRGMADAMEWRVQKAGYLGYRGGEGDENIIKIFEPLAVTPAAPRRIGGRSFGANRPGFARVPKAPPRPISAAAIKLPDGSVHTGHSHWEALNNAIDAGALARSTGMPSEQRKLSQAIDGFVDAQGEFLDRAQAAKRVKKLGQVSVGLDRLMKGKSGKSLASEIIQSRYAPFDEVAGPRTDGVELGKRFAPEREADDAALELAFTESLGRPLAKGETINRVTDPKTGKPALVAHNDGADWATLKTADDLRGNRPGFAGSGEPTGDVLDESRLGREIPATASVERPPLHRAPRADFSVLDNVLRRVRSVYTPNAERALQENPASAGWYDTSQLRQLFEETSPTGTEDFQMFSKFMGPTSAGTNVPKNISEASYWFNQWKKGEIDAGNMRSRTEAKDFEIPAGFASRFQRGRNIGIASILEDGDINPIEQPKIWRYAHGIFGDNWGGAPLDVHVGRQVGNVGTFADGTKGRGFPTASYSSKGQIQSSPMKTHYAPIEDAVAREAEKLGVAPIQYQSAGWVGGAGETGVSDSRPLISLFNEKFRRTAKKYGYDTPLDAAKAFAKGETPLWALVGTAGLGQFANARESQ